MLVLKDVESALSIILKQMNVMREQFQMFLTVEKLRLSWKKKSNLLVYKVNYLIVIIGLGIYDGKIMGLFKTAFKLECTDGENCKDVSLCVDLIGVCAESSGVSSLRRELRGLPTAPLCEKHLRERRALGGNEWMMVDDALKMIERGQRQRGGIEKINIGTSHGSGDSFVEKLKKVYTKK